MQLLNVKARSIFRLDKDVCLEATAPVRLYIPGGLLVQGEKVSDVVRLSDDDIEIGLKEAADNPEKLSAIVIFMRPMDRISLGRSAEVVADSDHIENIVFNVPIAAA